MIRINLLPYRAARRRQEILQHIVVAIAVLGAAIVISLTAHIYITAAIASLESEYTGLKQRNAELQKKIGKIRDLDRLRQDVQSKLDIVEKLQRGRFRSLNTFYHLAKETPENVWLTEVEDDTVKITVKGLGESNKAVANFMRALDQSLYFGDVRLQVIERTSVGSVSVRKFELTMLRSDESKNAPSDSGKGKTP